MKLASSSVEQQLQDITQGLARERAWIVSTHQALAQQEAALARQGALLANMYQNFAVPAVSDDMRGQDVVAETPPSPLPIARVVPRRSRLRRLFGGGGGSDRGSDRE